MHKGKDMIWLFMLSFRLDGLVFNHLLEDYFILLSIKFKIEDIWALYFRSRAIWPSLALLKLLRRHRFDAFLMSKRLNLILVKIDPLIEKTFPDSDTSVTDILQSLHLSLVLLIATYPWPIQLLIFKGIFYFGRLFIGIVLSFEIGVFPGWVNFYIKIHADLALTLCEPVVSIARISSSLNLYLGENHRSWKSRASRRSQFCGLT